MKVSVSTALEEVESKRLERLATADARSFSSVLRLAVIKGLPALEREILGEQFAGKAAVKKLTTTPQPIETK